MDIPALIIALAFGAIAFVVIWICQEWATKRFVDRFVNKFMAEAIAAAERPRLKPESDFFVDISETAVTCRRPDGKTESVNWSDLQRVEILTTDDGPSAPDIFWVLYGSSGGCVIPWGANGGEDLLDRLQSLPGFRNDAIVNAASLTANNQLPCWERSQ